MEDTSIPITLDADLVDEIDLLVSAGGFPSRSEAIRAAVADLLAKQRRERSLFEQLGNLDIAEEQALANEALIGDAF